MNSAPSMIDTSPEAFAVQLDCWRNLTPQERLRKSCALSNQVKRMAMDAIRRRHPNLAEDEVRLVFIELNFGKSLADDVRRWQQEQSL